MPNIQNAEIKTRTDRKAFLDRIFDALVMADEFACFPRGWKQMTPDQIANWEAREFVISCRQNLGSHEVVTSETPEDVSTIYLSKERGNGKSGEARSGNQSLTLQFE